MNFRALMRWPTGQEGIRTGTTWIQAAIAQGAKIIPSPINRIPDELKKHVATQEGIEQDTQDRAGDAPESRKDRRRRRKHEAGAGVHASPEGRPKHDANG